MIKRAFKLFIAVMVVSSALYAEKKPYIAMYDNAKYKNGFEHFEYANPNAPKGGSLKQAVRGTFDSLNPFILKGSAASSLGYVFDTLMESSSNEPFTYYPLIAKEVEVSPKNDWVKFYVDKRARFHDGSEVTALDVKFSFETLINKGSPAYKRYYFDVKDVEVVDKYTVKFNFKTTKNQELPLILAQIQVMSKKYWEGKDFLKSNDIIPMGSGAYKISKYSFGKYIIYERDKNYWAKDLPVNKGIYNFDFLQFDYYKDTSVLLEAFKSGEYDFRLENISKNWATQYVGKNFDEGKLIKEEINHENAQGMQAFVYNIRNPLFENLEVRKAIAMAFDFEWINKKLFYGQYKRLNSYFANCELSSTKLPKKDELKFLEPLKGEIPDSVFTSEFKNPTTNGSGKIRKQLRSALKILKQNGWALKNRVLTHTKTGKKFEFEILLVSPSFERVVQPFIKNLKKIGIIAKMKLVDTVTYQNRVREFDYDMMVGIFPVSLSPGNELTNFWGSKSADIKGSRNFIGIKSQAIDKLISNVVTAPTREELVSSVRALDRVLLHNYYVIPNWYISTYRISYWNKFERPKNLPKYGLTLDTWWSK